MTRAVYSRITLKVIQYYIITLHDCIIMYNQHDQILFKNL